MAKHENAEEARTTSGGETLREIKLQPHAIDDVAPNHLVDFQIVRPDPNAPDAHPEPGDGRGARPPSSPNQRGAALDAKLRNRNNTEGQTPVSALSRTQARPSASSNARALKNKGRPRKHAKNKCDSAQQAAE